jgi:hypothetical protein
MIEIQRSADTVCDQLARKIVEQCVALESARSAAKHIRGADGLLALLDQIVARHEEIRQAANQVDAIVRYGEAAF